MESPPNRIDIISDVICPWCYIGKRQLELALPELKASGLQLSVHWNPFQLNPDMPAEGRDRMSYRMAKFGSAERCAEIDANITGVAASLGLEFHLDRQTRTPNTVAAHRVIWLAGQHNVQDAVVEALFKGFFCEGRDIGDGATLADIADGAGLRAGLVQAMLASTDGLDIVVNGDAMARNAGISGVPSFALSGHVLFSGAQPAAEMVANFRHAHDVLSRRAA